MTTHIDIVVPDLGNITEAKIIEIFVQVGGTIELEESILSVETEKTTIEIPATEAGTIQAIHVKEGDIITAQQPIVTVVSTERIKNELETQAPKQTDFDREENSNTIENDIHASPMVRRLARERNIPLDKVTSTGPKNRILEEDLEKFAALKSREQPLSSLEQLTQSLTSLPLQDFNEFGPTQSQPFSRIKKLSASILHRNWLLAPHVTQFGEADITELEAFRKKQQTILANTSTEKSVKLTLLSFIMKAAVNVLQRFPQFNASLSPDQQSLILKKYYHVGVAVDTPEGLVVPVIREVNQKRLIILATELSAMSTQARKGQLSSADMQGHSFSISSLGSLGGGLFTPIINLPDVAILGIAKATIKPVYQASHFEPRLLLPLALSYDHRVIDGAEAVRFMSALVDSLSDIREWLL